VERVEVCAEVAHDIRKARPVEQREDLVILAPEFTQPLHRQRLWHHHETALDFSRVHESIQDQRGFNRLPEADLVGEEPPYRVPRPPAPPPPHAGGRRTTPAPPAQ